MCNFAGSSIDDQDFYVFPGTHGGSHIFRGKKPKPTIQTEIYSLGSAIYEISTTRQPYHDKTERDIENLYNAGIFPDIDHLTLGPIIRKCWTFQYNSVKEIIYEMDKNGGEYSPTENENINDFSPDDGCNFPEL